MRVLERKNYPQNTGETAGKALPGILHSLYARPVQSTSAESNLVHHKRIQKWLLWSLLTIVLWGTWGLVSKIASTGVDAYMNQLLYTAGLAPLMVFVAITVHRERPDALGTGLVVVRVPGETERNARISEASLHRHQLVGAPPNDRHWPGIAVHSCVGPELAVSFEAPKARQHLVPRP